MWHHSAFTKKNGWTRESEPMDETMYEWLIAVAGEGSRDAKYAITDHRWFWLPGTHGEQLKNGYCHIYFKDREMAKWFTIRWGIRVV